MNLRLAFLLSIIIAAFGLQALAQNELPELRSSIPVPVQSEPDGTSLDRSKGQDWHRLSAKLSGSMCVACLMQLEERLRTFPGVSYAKVNRPESQPDKAEKTRAASVVVWFDTQSVKLAALLECIKNEKYKHFELQDVPR